MKSKKSIVNSVLFVLFLVFLFACNSNNAGNSSEDHNPNAAGSAHLYLKYNTDQRVPVTMTVHWSGRLLNPTGTTGSDSPFNLQEYYEMNPSPAGEIFVNKLQPGLRPGRWGFRCSVGSWSASCEQDILANRKQNVNFTFGKSGCMTGLSYP